MTIEAKVIADSKNIYGNRVTTLQLKYPRFIHSELMTHRSFSRNASSSRAIPVKKMIEDVMNDPAMPIHWGKNIPGMQAKEECSAPILIDKHHYHDSFLDDDEDSDTFEEYLTTYIKEIEEFPCKEAWLEARDRAVEIARAFSEAGYHKQIVNRLLEPFQHIHVVVTATEWNNFFALRRHEDAQPEIKALADAIYVAMQESEPEQLIKLSLGGQQYKEWHLPYVTEKDWYAISKINIESATELLIKCSVARCARVSYLKHDGGTPSVEEDLKLYDRLINHSPMHASPAEHQCTADEAVIFTNGSDTVWKNPHLHGNLRGFIQYRKTLKNECVYG